MQGLEEGKYISASLVHYKDLYSTFPRLLLRSAPNRRTSKKNNSKVRAEECIRMDPRSTVALCMALKLAIAIKSTSTVHLRR